MNNHAPIAKPAQGFGPDLRSVRRDDPLRLMDQLSEDKWMLRDTATVFTQTTLQPGVTEATRDVTRDATVAPDIFKAMRNAWLLGTPIPEEYGARGAGGVTYGLVAREMERVDSVCRSMMPVQSSLLMYPIHADGSDDQRRKYLSGFAAADQIGCLGLTEPDAKSDPGGMKPTANKPDDGYVLNGSKMWISHAPSADDCVVWTKSEAHGGKIRDFVLDRGMDRLNAPTTGGTLSLRASVGEIVMKDVAVGEGAILCGVEGLKGPFGCLNRARYAIAWGVIGAAGACWNAARGYGLDRKQVGKPLAQIQTQIQLFQKKLADMQTEITLGLRAALQVGSLIEAGKAAPEMISLIKRNNCGKALDAARYARGMHGRNGISEDIPVKQHMVNLETMNTYEGTHDVHTLIHGRAQIGLQAFF